MMRNKKRLFAPIQGFTLVEVVIVVSIFALIIGFTISSFQILNQGQALNKSADLVATTLREARSLTLASKNGSQYGVHLENSQIVLFEGSSYASTTSSNVFFPLNPLVNISTTTLAGGSAEVIFDRLTGDTSEIGTIEISLVTSTTTTKVITVSGAGLVEVGP